MVTSALDHVPFELHADMPPGSASWKARSTSKFGSWRCSSEREQHITLADTQCTIEINFDKARKEVNARLANWLVYFSQNSGLRSQASTACAAIFCVRFSSNRDMISPFTLVETASPIGSDSMSLSAHLLIREDVDQVTHTKRHVAASDETPVLTLHIEDEVSGRQSSSVFRSVSQPHLAGRGEAARSGVHHE
jgi:predicted DsbA family dithiol-disulfide isomerase